MKIIQAIAKRSDVSPQEGKSKYGDVTYADERNKKYPLDSEKHVRAAWSYINMPKNASKYSAADVATIKRKIKAAGKNYGIEFSDDGDKKAESSVVVMADATQTFSGDAPSQIMYMPKGDWHITPRVGGVPQEVTVTVDQGTAATLQASFEQRLAKPVRPIGGFDHKQGSASFIPKGFLWDEQKGVLLNVDWTKAGREAIEGRNYSYFSPTFLLSNKQVAGLTARGEIGSLTNSPAFEDGERAIQRIAASSDPDDEIDPDDDATRGITMTVGKKLVELELITAEQGDDEDAIVSAINALSEELGTVRASNAALVQENASLKTEADRIKGSEADTVIQAAIAEGKIPSQDKDLIGYYRAQLIAQPVVTKKAITAMHANPVLKQQVTVKAGDSGDATVQNRSKAAVMANQHAIVKEIMAANPGLTFAEAWTKAKREHKEAFVEA